VFRLGGSAELPPAVDEPLVIDPPPLTAGADAVANGKRLYLTYCVFCHGDGAVSGGATPDLRALTAEKHQQFQAIVRGGLHWEKGMVGFADAISEAEAEDVRAYLVDRAHYTLQQAALDSGDG
jgi:quinohemoprotein ethanol dehydrogenase